MSGEPCRLVRAEPYRILLLTAVKRSRVRGDPGRALARDGRLRDDRKPIGPGQPRQTGLSCAVTARRVTRIRSQTQSRLPSPVQPFAYSFHEIALQPPERRGRFKVILCRRLAGLAVLSSHGWTSIDRISQVSRFA